MRGHFGTKTRFLSEISEGYRDFWRADMVNISVVMVNEMGLILAQRDGED